MIYFVPRKECLLLSLKSTPFSNKYCKRLGYLLHTLQAHRLIDARERKEISFLLGYVSSSVPVNALGLWTVACSRDVVVQVVEPCIGSAGHRDIRGLLLCHLLVRFTQQLHHIILVGSVEVSKSSTLTRGSFLTF